MNKKLLVVLVLAVLIVVGTGGFMIFTKNNDPSDTFNSFLKAQASQKQAAVDGGFEAQGINITDLLSVDVSSKQVINQRTIKCEAKYLGNTIALNVSVYSYGNDQYLRLDNISGVVKAASGPTRDTTKVFSKVKGNWYKVAEPEMTTMPMAESGVFVFDTGVIAPSFDSDKIVKAFAANEVFVIVSSNNTDNGTTYKLKVDRVGYQAMLSSTFPDLKNTDKILDGIFGRESSKTITVYDATAEGKYSSVASDINNYCNIVYTTFPGLKIAGQPSRISGVTKPIEPAQVKKINITNAKSANLIITDLQL